MKSRINIHAGKTRSGEVVVRSMLSSQLACILTAIVPQLVIILNGIIVSRLLGEECFKAISAFNPISGVVFILINTCCVGPSIQAGKAYGELDSRTANSLFSFATLMTGIIGVLSVLVFIVFRNGIAEAITSDQSLQGYLASYISPTGVYLLLQISFSCFRSYWENCSHFVSWHGFRDWAALSWIMYRSG